MSSTPRREPRGLVMLAREPRLRARADEGCEHGDQRHLVGAMLVERLEPAHVVEPERCKAGFLAQLAERRLDGELAALDAAVHRLRAARTAPAVPAAQHEHFDLTSRSR